MTTRNHNKSERIHDLRQARLIDRAVDSVEEGIIITDPALPDNPIIFVNRAFERLTGYSAQEVLGRNCRFLQGPNTCSETLAILRRAIDEEKPCEVTLLNYRKDGGTFWNKISISVIRDDNGSTIHFVGVQKDVTIAIELTRALARQKALLSSIVNHIPTFVSWKDTSLIYQGCNEKFARAAGLERTADIVGLNDFDMPWGRKSTASARELDRCVIESGKPLLNTETTITNSTGNPIHLLVSRVPLRNADDEIIGVLGVATDITTQKIDEQRRQEAQKLELIGRMTSGIAHDYNNFLAIIQNSAELLADEAETPECRMEYVKQITDTVSRAGKLTRKLLAFSNPREPSPCALDIGELLQSADKLINQMLGHKCTLRMELSKSKTMVKTDPVQLEQIVFNMAANARDAMPDGGTFTIRTSVINTSDETVAPKLAVEFIDTGIGIGEEQTRKIFEPFFTTKKNGHGLGLATCQQLAVQNHGIITVRSRPGHGTTFTLTFPLVPA